MRPSSPPVFSDRGTTYEIRHPELVKVGMTKAELFFPKDDQPHAIVLRHKAVVLVDLIRLEPALKGGHSLMPLHDWSERSEWEGVHIYWMGEIAQWLKTRLPPGYRAIIGSSPFAHLGVSLGKPDGSVTNGTKMPYIPASAASPEPDFETVVATLVEDHTLLVELNQRLVAAVEIISSANKDRPERRDQYATRYLGYIRAGVHLLLIDVHAWPFQFSFAQRIGNELHIEQAVLPTPQATSYRVGPAAPLGGRFLSVWSRPLEIGTSIPAIPIAISANDQLTINLETTYMEAARKAYVVE